MGNHKSGWFWTERIDEIPSQKLNSIVENMEIDFETESLVCVTGTMRTNRGGGTWIVVTEKRVAALPFTGYFSQSFFEDVTGVEGAGDRASVGIVRTTGDSLNVYWLGDRPPKALRVRLMSAINKQWGITKSDRAADVAVDVDIVGQLEKLVGLREKDAITAEEFEAAKGRLLGMS